MDLSYYAVDPQASQEGKWFNVGRENPKAPMARVKVARFNNRKYKEKQQALMRELIEERGGIEGGAIKREDMDPLIVKALAHAVLIDWEHLELFGAPLGEWSEEKATALLGDERLLDFREWIVSLSQGRENFRIQEMEETTGKS